MPRLVREMSCMPTVCVDTNIWIYALSVPITGDASKHQIAQSSIQTSEKITLTPQIINELGFALRRKHTWTDDDLRPMFAHLLGSCALHIPSKQLAPKRPGIEKHILFVLLGQSDCRCCLGSWMQYPNIGRHAASTTD